MNYRINTKIIFLVVVLVIVAFALFVYTLVSAPNVQKENVVTDSATTTEDVSDIILTAKHQYLDGIHTIAGKATLPTPCHRLVSEPFFIGENEVEVRFSTIMVGEECPSQLFDEKFSVSFEAPENVDITALWNGKKIRLNLIPLQEGEKLDDEIYIKG